MGKLQSQVKIAPKPFFTQSQNGLLQRKCACGGTPGVDGECAACHARRLSLQRQSISGPEAAPPIVHEVLRSPGQPLDPATRAFMEPRFGHDFSRVRVHTDSHAAASAREVNALAYTVGRDIAFASGNYQPATLMGRQLIAHELAHTIQQENAMPQPVQAFRLSRPDDASELEADQVANAALGRTSIAVQSSTPLVLARQPEPFPKGPSPSPSPSEPTEEKPDFSKTGLSTERGRLSSWGWGAPETNNIYHDCNIEELERSKFLQFVRSLAVPPQDRGRRKKPMNAEDVFGITHFDPNKAKPPEIAAVPFDDAGKTHFKLRPTHAEMPPIRAAYTKAAVFIEGAQAFGGEECKEERIIQNRKTGSAKLPVQWNLTPEGAQKFKEAEQEHCNDIRYAFDMTLGLYASGINNVAAAERTYSTEQQAVQDAISYIGVTPDKMLINFYEMALKTRLRDDREWHTGGATGTQTGNTKHHQIPSLQNGCRYVETVDAESLPDVGKHPSSEVVESAPAPRGKR
jgi:hypothetical protein